MEEDDAMDIDETISSAQIIIRESTGVQIIGGPTSLDSKTEESAPKDQPSKNPDVVVLDDDEEEPVPSKKPKKPEEDVEVIDLVEKSVNSKCINYACKSGKDLLVAPNLCLSYYRVKNSGKGNKEVCTECYEIAIREYDMLASELQAGNVLCNVEVPFRNDTVEIDDSDEEDQEARVSPLDDESLKFFEENLERVLSETMAKLNVVSHAEKEVDFLKEKNNRINGELSELQAMIKDTRNSLDSIQFNLYKECRPETVEKCVISIVDDHYTSGGPIVRTESVLPSITRKSQRTATKLVSYAEVDSPVDSPKPDDVPIVGNPEPLVVRIDEIYYISRENSSGCWIKARLKRVLYPGTVYNDQPCTTTLYKMLELKQHKERVVDGKSIASMKHSTIRLETGTRVIAVFKEIGPTGEPRRMRHEPYYPGIVAEPPVAQNKYRYLIFFDIGYSQYVNYTNVHVVFEASKNVWEDMHVNSRSFIKKYLESADRPMVKLSTGQTVRVEYNGKWVLCKIMSVDCSLVLVLFESLGRMEWIYRGSTRLSPMFKEEQNATKRHTGGRTSNRKQSPSESATIVQYTKNADFEKPAENNRTVRAVARKSTARPENTSTGGFVPFLPQVNNPVSSEPTSKIMYFTPRDQVITQRLYRAHICSPACKDYVRHSLGKLRGHNPLSKPLLCGWARMTLKVKGRKEIVYKAPCSQILRNMEEVHHYLRITKSEMTVDLFDFNHMVRCLAEFCVECNPDPKDLSKGLEQVAIPVINGINNEMLDFCNYATKRVPMEDVPLNTDPEFLIGCDCTDDCSDKMKCACWQLTLEGAKYMGKNVDPNTIGYVYRRLHEQVLTGIYECNSRCKCASTCLNRVVQNPMSIKLQVFRTHNRGWGIRCVNDVPQGTFICIYAGTIHTEQMANEDGVTYGDEYFAELDYIENCEKHKEDYESDVNEPESPRSRSVTPDDEEEEKKPDGRRRRWQKHPQDNDFTPSYPLVSGDFENSMRLRRRREEEPKIEERFVKKEEKIENVMSEIETVTISDDEDDPKEVLSFNPKSGSDLDDNKPSQVSVRSFFGEEEPYIMDTKNAGNIGRFLNHSCSPNVFVQNVFVDTHDLRFPWVAFFCSQFIRAGTELTWNYNYDIGSVPGRVLYCHCGSLECKGRLL
ncbi:histone-lysine N-methyltransferase eggless-like [Tribolium madens]|uniref:histone-lysine N-methyltransferase eggless-like n=1 Tax=Tribolium madens TaxID=41895 RepID=UPI001CF74D36|nr:histone-lysine N-methyltransferase eggless-like [Tribolium madens]XP_044261530.1 histone-lysine N-methyltransferase eggless-like [Tribolium madens]